MPDRSLTCSRAGVPPCPPKPAWFHRLEEILGALRSMTSTHLDRSAVGANFEGDERQRCQNLRSVGTGADIVVALADSRGDRAGVHAACLRVESDATPCGIVPLAFWIGPGTGGSGGSFAAGLWLRHLLRGVVGWGTFAVADSVYRTVQPCQRIAWPPYGGHRLSRGQQLLTRRTELRYVDS